MSLKFAGVRLPLATEEVEDFASTYHPLKGFDFADVWGSDGSGLDHLPLPSLPVEPEMELGRLYWPTGLCRCAVFQTLIDSDGLADIRTALGTGSAGPADLVMTDGTGNSRTFSLYFLSADPLFQITGKTQLFVLTLVDSRYFLRERTGSITAAPASWSALFASLASQLGITLTVDTVSANYGAPTDRWVCYEKPLSLLVDAACNAIGHRLVANLNGTFTTQTYATASAAASAQTATLTKTAGGTFVSSDLIRSVPATAGTVFIDATTGNTYSVLKTLASLSLTEYGAATGVAGQEVSLVGELVYDGTNLTALTNYATQAATDYYKWRLIDLDITYPGICQWTPTAAEDLVEWRYQPNGRLLTRIVRPPMQVLTKGGAEYGPRSVNNPAGPEPLVRVTDVATGGGEFSRRYTVKQVEITDTAGDLNAVDVSPTQEWTDVVELANYLVPLSADADPQQGVYPLHTAPDGHKYIIADEAAYFPSGSGATSGSGDDFEGSPRRLVYYDERVQCEDGWLSIYKFPIYQFANGLIQAAEGELEWDRIEGCCNCGSGHPISGSGYLHCVYSCDQCSVNGMSSQFTFTVSDTGGCSEISTGTKTLYYEPLADGSNNCRWVSVSGDEVWELYFDYDDLTWYLVAQFGLLIYAIDQIDWVCNGDNGLLIVYNGRCDLPKDDAITVQPVTSCTGGGGGGGYVTLSCCPSDPVDTTLYAHFSGGTGSCTCLDGKTATLTWTGAIFTGSVAGCSGTITFSMNQFCSYGFTGSCSSLLQTTGPTTCSPFALTDTVTVSGCCTGDVTVLIDTIP